MTSMHSRACRTAAALVTALALGGCTSSVGPSDVTGTYVLRSIGGDALPAVLDQNAIDEAETVYADTIRIRADGTGSRATRSLSGVLGDPEQYYVQGIHSTVHGRDVELFYDCPANAQCIGIPPAHLTTNGLVIDANDVTRGPRVYTRVSTSP